MECLCFCVVYASDRWSNDLVLYKSMCMFGYATYTIHSASFRTPHSALLFVLIGAVHRAVGISVDFLFQVGL